jgi:hypothetical protein
MKLELKWKRDKNDINKVCTQRMKTEIKNEDTKIKEERYELRERRKQTGSPVNTTNLKQLVKPILNARSIPESELRRVKAMLFLPSRREWEQVDSLFAFRSLLLRVRYSLNTRGRPTGGLYHGDGKQEAPEKPVHKRQSATGLPSTLTAAYGAYPHSVPPLFHLLGILPPVLTSELSLQADLLPTCVQRLFQTAPV